MNRVEKVDYNIFRYIIRDKELYTYIVDEIPVDAVYVELILRRKNLTLFFLKMEKTNTPHCPQHLHTLCDVLDPYRLETSSWRYMLHYHPKQRHVLSGSQDYHLFSES